MKRLTIQLFAFTFALHLLSARAETYTLIGQRHLRLYTAPEPTQSYNASIDAQTVADSLCNVPWTRAMSSEATSTSHVSEQLDANVANRDRFDAALFCAFHTNGMHTAYANAAVYRYRLPDGTLPRLTSLAAKVSSDPYNALGARIVLYTNETGEIPTDCATCRGEAPGGIRLTNVAKRVTKAIDGKSYWYPTTTNVVFTVPAAPSLRGADDLPSGGLALQRYLFVFVLMENYSTSRGNWLEGCSWIENLVSVTTDAPIPGWTDGQTVDLSGETEDTPADAGIRADSDNDGLTDFRERMASTVLTNLYGTTPVDASKMTTYPGQLVPDYFLPVTSGGTNWTYLGALLTDHDFVEDWLEDDEALFSGDRKASRYQNDSHQDYDANGWDNWSEARAYLENPDDYPGRPCPRGRIRVVYNGDRAFTGSIIVHAYNYRNGQIPPMTVLADETWTLPVGSKNSWYDLRSSPDSHLQQGKKMFVVYNDEDANGAWTPGEPYGIVADVEVGYASIAESEVELTDCNSSIMRIDLAGALAENSFARQISFNDRGVNTYQYDPNMAVSSLNQSNVLENTSRVRLRLVRYQVNWQSSYYSTSQHKTYYVGEVLLDWNVNLAVSPLMTEALLHQAGMLDLDWGTDLDDLCYYQNIGANRDNLGVISYAVVVGDGEWTPSTPLSDVNYMSTVFVNAFEATADHQQTRTVPTGLASDSNASRPIFTWKHDNQIGKAYPAFRLRVYRRGGSTLVYDTGALRAPIRMPATGEYRFSPALYAGMTTATGEVFEDGEYYYTVSMLDAKFPAPNTNETKSYFTLSANGAGGDVSDKYSIRTAVKYFGPASTNNPIRVEAFETPDFAGQPAALTYVRTCDDLANPSNLACNAQLTGLESGKAYYVRAFLDSDGDGILDDGEPWGYCNYVGTNRRDVYTPQPFSFRKGTSDMPKAVVYLEDVDVEPLDLSTVVTED